MHELLFRAWIWTLGLLLAGTVTYALASHPPATICSAGPYCPSPTPHGPGLQPPPLVQCMSPVIGQCQCRGQWSCCR
jgi:hypothetical protein